MGWAGFMLFLRQVFSGCLFMRVFVRRIAPAKKSSVLKTKRKNAMRHCGRVMCATACAAMLILPAGCGSASRGGEFCLLYRPVYLHESDTEDTKIQIDGNNAVWLEFCEK